MISISQSTARKAKFSAALGVILMALGTSACGHTSAVFPDARELRAVTETKPKPSPAVLTDPAASDRHNAAIESWGERIHAAGVRLCRFYDRQGMPDLKGVCP